MAYVYTHIRKDNNKIFYVGIGKTKNFKRAYSKCDRNKYWKNIVNKVGYSVEIIYNNITWDEACNIEKYLIKQYGRKDLNTGELVNMTAGGDGIVGLIQTNEHKRKNSEANKGKPKSQKFIESLKNRIVSNETKLKISQSNKGRHHTEETKKKISNKLKNKMVGKNNPFYGKKHSDETKEKIRKYNIGKNLSDETKKKISQSNMGKKRVFTDETKNKMSISAKERNVIPPSRKGTCWIIKNNDCKSIKVEELNDYILNGWMLGRKIIKNN